MIGDKAYDSSTLRQIAAAKGVKTCIPRRSNRRRLYHFRQSSTASSSRGKLLPEVSATVESPLALTNSLEGFSGLRVPCHPDHPDLA